MKVVRGDIIERSVELVENKRFKIPCPDSFIAVTNSCLHGFCPECVQPGFWSFRGDPVRRQGRGQWAWLGTTKGVETGGEEVEEGGDKEAGNKVGWTDDLGGLETDVGTRVSSGVSGVCLFGHVPVTWRIYILLHSDSEGIWMLPGTEGRRVGSTSGR